MYLGGLMMPLLATVLAQAAGSAPEPRSATKSEAHDDRGTLEAIHIEGKLDLPQVLFITSRDQLRYRDPLHRAYQKDFVRVGQKAPLPVRLTLPKEEN